MATTEDRLGMDPDLNAGSGKSFSIRAAKLADLEEIAALEAAAFSNPWNTRTFRSLIRREGVLISVAEAVSGGILGYSVCWWVQDQAELANLAVKEEFRGRGVGSALLDQVLLNLARAGVDTLFLEVRVSNDEALALYRSRGFVQVALRRDYYRNPREDARILLKQLRAGPARGIPEE